MTLAIFKDSCFTLDLLPCCLQPVPVNYPEEPQCTVWGSGYISAYAKQASTGRVKIVQSVDGVPVAKAIFEGCVSPLISLPDKMAGDGVGKQAG